jgi:hypothetical protein
LLSRVRGAVAVGVAALVCLLVVASPAAAFTGKNGMIAFVGPGPSAKDSSDLWIAAADGTGAVDLTRHDGMWEASPMWFVEPDRILFVAGAPGGPGDVYSMGRNGAGLADLTRTSDRNESTPAWSTGGGRIAYAGGPWNGGPGSSDIWTMSWTGTGQQDLTKNADARVSNTNPVWSPNQGLLAYVRWTDGTPGLRLMSPGGLFIRNAVDLALLPGRDPAWDSHRDGDSFLLAYADQGALWEIRVPVVLPERTGELSVSPVRLTTPPQGASDGHPVFSPDGTKLLFQRGDRTMMMDARPDAAPHVVVDRQSVDPDWEPLCTRQAAVGGSTLRGTPDDDLLCGGPGADTIDGNGGDDVIFAGDGFDHVNGGAGDDFILGGVGSDGNVIHGGSGDDSIEGGRGDDWLYGDGGDDRIEGAAGNDHVDGGDGDDSLIGGTGIDWLHGGPGNDLLNVLDGRGGDLSDGGTGLNTCFDDRGDLRKECELPR